MRSHQAFNLRKRQSGSTLIISLIILVLLMLLGVTAMNTSDTQYKLAGNLQFEEIAMNNTETSVSTAETWLAASSVANYNNAGFTAYNSLTTPELYPAAAGVDPLTLNWTDATSKQVGADNQRYIIEQVSTNSRLAGSSQAVGGRTSTGCNQVNTYRVTARGTSSRGATKFVQSYYSVLSC